MDPFNGYTRVEQYFLNGSDDTTWATVQYPNPDESYDIVLDFDPRDKNANLRKSPKLGQCILIIEIKTVTGSGNVIIYGKNVYGSMYEQHANKWKIKTVSCSTTPKVFTSLLHISNANKYDPNATGLRITLNNDAIGDDIQYRGRVLRV